MLGFWRSAVAAAALVCGFAAPAVSQTAWPTKPLRIIVTFAPGGGADIATRHLQPILQEVIGQSVVVENKAGGGGIVGTDALVNAPPDGHTIAMVISALTSSPAMQKTLPYDVRKDVKPITVLFRSANVWVAHPSAPYKTLAEVIAAAKAAPGKVAVVTSGAGSAQHLGIEQLKLTTGIDVVHVPYRGAGPALSDLTIGQVQLGVLNISSTLPHVKEGRLRALAVTSGQRSSYAPDIPSVAETVPGVDSVEWFGFVAPAGVPDDVIAKLHAAIVKAARTEKYAEKVKEMGVELVLNSTADFSKQISDELTKFADLVKRANIKVD